MVQNKDVTLSLRECFPHHAVASRVVQEMADRWQAGERPLAEEFLNRHPHLHEEPDAMAQILCEELCLRTEYGLEADGQSLMRRFPQCRSQLEVMLSFHDILKDNLPPRFPEAGEQLGEFSLAAVLGEGALGRVYLATQPGLAHRPVVLKVTPREGEEHLSLARLQHTHIVPLYQMLHDLPHNLRILCMPFFGGTSLEFVLRELQTKPVGQRSAKDLIRVLDQAQARLPIQLPAQGPARMFLEKASYVQAVCWIGTCLADALQYAHERELVHLDLKPSNVLLAVDGQPMLLDFHLARKPLGPGSEPEYFGGTPRYMSPEQRQVIGDIQQGRPVSLHVDGRSDLYSLGMVLYEMLSGTCPNTPARVLHRCNPQVSRGLSDIIGKCLQPALKHRYQQAGHLAGDLRRHLAHLPLQGVTNRSLAERWRKWRIRRPHVMTIMLLSLLLLAGAAWAGYLVWHDHRQTVREAERALVQGRGQIQEQQYEQAIQTLSEGLEAGQRTPGQQRLVHDLQEELLRARQSRLVAQLHHLVNRLRLQLNVAAIPPAKAQTLAQACRRLWDQRQSLWALNQTSMISPLRTDLLDLAALWSDLLIHSSTPGGDPVQAKRAALRVLQEAEQLLGGSLILYRKQQRLAVDLGMKGLAKDLADQVASLKPETPWEHYTLGRSLLADGKLPQALEHLNEAVALQPDGVWGNFYQGICHFRLRHYPESISAFRTCIALAPEKAECYFNRALAYEAMGQWANAQRDYNRTLQLDPAMSAGWLNRGILHYHGKRYPQSIADLNRALQTGGDPVRIQYNLALVYQAKKEYRTALKHVQQALQLNPSFQQAAILKKVILSRLAK